MCFWSFQTGSWYSAMERSRVSWMRRSSRKNSWDLMMTGTEAGELGLDKSMASEKKEEQA